MGTNKSVVLIKSPVLACLQAKVLLRTLVSRSSEECPSAEDETNLSSPRGSPSLLDEKGVKPTQPLSSRTKPTKGYWPSLIEKKIIIFLNSRKKQELPSL